MECSYKNWEKYFLLILTWETSCLLKPYKDVQKCKTRFLIKYYFVLEKVTIHRNVIYVNMQLVYYKQINFLNVFISNS